MPLPDLIAIEPLTGRVRAEVTVPGSKSVTNRALVLAALASGTTTLRGALWSEDTQLMAEALRRLGFAVEVAPDPDESSNRTIVVEGRGGVVPSGGSVAQPLDLDVGNAGTAARFLAALVCLGAGVYRLEGSPRMHERPQADLFAALRELGYRIDAPNDRLPARIHGGGTRPGSCRVRIDQSSQFASALLLSARAGGWTVLVEDESAEEAPYVRMTRELVSLFPPCGGECAIEADASSGSYFWAVNALGADQHTQTHRVRVARWPASGWQIDERFPRCIPLPLRLSRQSDLGDSIMTAIVLGPLAPHPTAFTHLGRLRVQECERVRALRAELERCGAAIEEEGDTLRILPSALHGADIETYGDHRMAMCFGILGLKVPGIRIKNPACVKKTFPDFFLKLAALPPKGLGATVRDARTGCVLSPGESMAE